MIEKPKKDPRKETIEETRRRLVEAECERDGVPLPEEIAERAAAVRRGWTNDQGVLLPGMAGLQGEGTGTERHNTPGIRVVKDAHD